MYFGSTYDTHIDLHAREIIWKNLKNQPLLWPKTSQEYICYIETSATNYLIFVLKIDLL